MQTEVIMKRELFGNQISQKSKSEFFSATDLERAGNKWRVSNGMSFFKMSDWFQLKSTKEFIKELEDKFGKVKISGNGRGSHTWIHPYLFIDMALAISPTLKIEVYAWIMDSLLKYRNDSGDSYKRMSGALFLSIANKSKYVDTLKQLAFKIKNECGVNNWESASEKQLKLRDKIHDNMSLILDIVKIPEKALDISIAKAKKQLEGK